MQQYHISKQYVTRLSIGLQPDVPAVTLAHTIQNYYCIIVLLGNSANYFMKEVTFKAALR